MSIKDKASTNSLKTNENKTVLILDSYYNNTNCCGATEGSDQQHNQDLKEICKGRRILEFITFYHNALHLTRVHCATNNSNINTGKFGGLECIVRCSDLEFSLWQIFYSTVRGLNKF